MYGSKKLQGFKKPETNVQNFTFQATTLQGSWGLTSVGPRTHLRNPIGQKSMHVRPFYRKFKSGSCETIHHLQRALYFFKIALYRNTAGLQKTPNICSNSIVQATTILRGSWGVDLGRTANTPAKFDRPKVNLRAFYRKFKFDFFKAIHYPYRCPVQTGACVVIAIEIVAFRVVFLFF